MRKRIGTMCALVACLATGALALDPRKSLTQFSRTIWTQERGLPQDTIRAITQTRDGYLWLGTDEGLARFDGYDFVVYGKTNGNLPDNSITALAAANDGGLWIGTTNGLTEYRDGRFRTYTTRQGLPDAAITALLVDHEGKLWVIAGVFLSRYEGGRFTTYKPEADIPLSSARAMCEDANRELWVAGFSRVARRTGGKFVTMMEAGALDGMVVLSMIGDHHGDIWIGGNKGIIQRTAGGEIRRYGTREGLPDPAVRALWEDRDGNIWAGTNNGMARLERGRFVTSGRDTSEDRDGVRCLFEDLEGDLWIGANGGLSRWRNDVFMAYGKPEGLPSDAPNTVFQDATGRVWVGFNDAGLVLFEGAAARHYTVRDGLPDSEVFRIRQGRNGELLVSTRSGLGRMEAGRFRTFHPPDGLGRTAVFDAMEDAAGGVWMARPAGLGVLNGGQFRDVVPGGPLLIDFMVTLSEGPDGTIWAGSYGKGMWRVKGDDRRHYTTADGLGSDQIRSIYPDADGTVWVGTFGGGLNALRNGRFVHFGEKDGLLSDNIGQVFDDGVSLWLSTTRGICRIARSQLAEFTRGKRRRLEPENYGVDDGLRSAQCAPAYPTASGGIRTRDGRLWFTTGRGLAVLDAGTRKLAALPPVAHLVEMAANGAAVDLTRPARLAPGNERVVVRYTGIHLSAPERVRYFYKLEGLDSSWVAAGARRVIDFSSLNHGHYRFHVRAELPGVPGSQQSYEFEILPRFWETAWFRILLAAALAAGVWASYQLRLRQIRFRFSLVLEERARLAREIHDTLAQGFVGISSQLDAVAMSMPAEAGPARGYLEMAQRMARHSLTEARRSVMDLRASALEGQNLGAAIESGMRLWTAGSPVEVAVEVAHPDTTLPQEMEQHLLRIAQEAVTNALKHAAPKRIEVRMTVEAGTLRLRITDDGRGFDEQDAFSSRAGHFGVLGMRERAERLGGKLRLASNPGKGTEVEVTVPLP